MNSWELKEAELLRKEHEYATKFNLFERILDNDMYFVLSYTMLIPFSFCIGLGIGLLIWR